MELENEGDLIVRKGLLNLFNKHGRASGRSSLIEGLAHNTPVIPPTWEEHVLKESPYTAKLMKFRTGTGDTESHTNWDVINDGGRVVGIRTQISVDIRALEVETSVPNTAAISVHLHVKERNTIPKGNGKLR